MKKCLLCNNPAVQGRSKCEKCLSYARQTQVKIRQFRKDNHLCMQCGKRPPLSTNVHCEPCRKKIRENGRKRYAKRVSTGLCIDCGKKVKEEGFSICSNCIEKRKAYNQRLETRTLRWFILERDNHQCQLCGKSCKGLHVHHILGNGKSESRLDQVIKNNTEISVTTLDNLITLCKPCHHTLTLASITPNPSLFIQLFNKLVKVKLA